MYIKVPIGIKTFHKIIEIYEMEETEKIWKKHNTNLEFIQKCLDIKNKHSLDFLEIETLAVMGVLETLIVHAELGCTTVFDFIVQSGCDIRILDEILKENNISLNAQDILEKYRGSDETLALSDIIQQFTSW